jgi:hypothetical protein
MFIFKVLKNVNIPSMTKITFIKLLKLKKKIIFIFRIHKDIFVLFKIN